MVKWQENIKILLLTVYCLQFTVLLGCASVKEYIETPSTSTGQIAVFIKGQKETSTDLTFNIEAVNIITEDGVYREIISKSLTINSLKIAGKQILLTEKALPIGRYKKLQFIVKEAFIKREGKKANLALPPEGISYDIDVIVSRNQAVSIFISWDVDTSIIDEYLFSPAFSIKGQMPELSSLLIYVTNEDSNNVSVINRQTGDIVATIMVGKNPRGIVTSLSRRRPRVYVANSGSNSVSVIDPTVNKVEFEIPIRYGTEPEGICVVSISPDKELIFVTNYGSDTVSVIDALSYQEIKKINVGSGPIAIATDPPIETLSNTRFLSFSDIEILRRYREKYFNVYVANKNSKDISIIRIDKTGNIIDDVINVDVEWSPMALAVDYQRAKLYVANYNYEDLSVIDLIQIAQGNVAGGVSSIPKIGTSVIGIIPDPDIDRIYLLKHLTNEIVIIRPFSEGFGTSITAAVSPVVGIIRVGSSPRSMIFDPEGRRIYIVNRGSNTVSVVDKTTRREESTIPVGKKPYGIAMFPF